MREREREREVKMRRANGDDGRGVNNTLETINAAASAIASAQNRASQPTLQVKSHIDIMNLSPLFSHKFWDFFFFKKKKKIFSTLHVAIDLLLYEDADKFFFFFFNVYHFNALDL